MRADTLVFHVMGVVWSTAPHARHYMLDVKPLDGARDQWMMREGGEAPEDPPTWGLK